MQLPDSYWVEFGVMPKLVFPVVVDKVIILEVLLDKLIGIYIFYGHSLKFPDQGIIRHWGRYQGRLKNKISGCAGLRISS